MNGNAIGTNQIGVFTNGNNTGIASNNISNSLVLDGVLLAGNNGQAQNNNITQSADAAVDIAGNGNTVSFNELLAADFGVLLEPGASGNNHFGNQFFAILKQISNSETPALAAMQALTNSVTAESVVAPGTTKANAEQRVSPSR